VYVSTDLCVHVCVGVVCVVECVYAVKMRVYVQTCGHLAEIYMYICISVHVHMSYAPTSFMLCVFIMYACMYAHIHTWTCQSCTTAS
jgi:hypothetical protein